MTTVVVEIGLVGGADGAPVELVGRGEVGFEGDGAGRLVLEVRIVRPLLLFDPTLVALGLLDVLALAMAGGWPGDSHARVHVRSRTDLFDEHGREVGGWRVVAALGRAGGGVRVDGQLLDHVAHIEPGERVVSVDAPWATMAQPLEREGVLLVGAWEERTGRGNGYRGVTTTVGDGWAWPWAGDEAVRMVLGMLEVCRIDDASPGETVTVKAKLTSGGLIQVPA